MTGQSEDNKPSLEVSPGEVRVTKLRNLWQRYKKTLSEGSKTSLGDFVEYIKSHDAALFDEITQTNHDDFLQGWEEKNKHFAHIVWCMIHPQEKNGQSRRDFLTTLTGATSALATSFLSGWTGPSILDKETGRYVVEQVMKYGNSILGNDQTNTISLLHGPVISWIRSINFLSHKKTTIENRIANSSQIQKLKAIKDASCCHVSSTNSIAVLMDFRIQLGGSIRNTVAEIRIERSNLTESIVTLLRSLPDEIQRGIGKGYAWNRWDLRPSEVIKNCLEMHTVDLTKKTKEDIRELERDVASYMTHYHGRAIVEDRLKRENVGTVEQFLKVKEKELSEQQKTTIEEITRACQSVINQVTIIERRYSPLSTN